LNKGTKKGYLGIPAFVVEWVGLIVGVADFVTCFWLDLHTSLKERVGFQHGVYFDVNWTLGLLCLLWFTVKCMVLSWALLYCWI